jgi:hypothetical protein
MGKKARAMFELTERQLKKLETIPMSYQNVFRNAFKGNRPAAVKANCLECMGYVRGDVHLCTTETCPMHKLRPYQNKKENTLSQNEALNDPESKSE